MKLNHEQYEKIAKYLPRQRGNVSMSNLELVNAILYVTENGCKWRALPESYGNWHTVYVRMNRWSKNGVLQRLFEGLQQENIIRIRMEAVCLDSTSIKVHPNGTGALLLPQFNTCSSAGVFDRLLVKKSFDLLRLFLNASHMGFCMFFKLPIPFCRRSFGKGRFQIPVQ